jgi:putative ATP-grasp target RiPP
VREKLDKKFLRLFIVLFFVLAIVGTVSAWPGYLTQWDETDHGSCHAGTYTESAGTLSTTISPVNATTAVLDPGTQFNVTLDITGFTAAANKHVLVGISAQLDDNHEFFFGAHDYMGELEADAFEVGLDAFGNANNTVTIIVYSPTKGGSHTLTIIAVEGGESFGTVQPFNYLKAEITVTVKSTGGGDIPGFELIFIFGSGILTIIPLVLITLRKRKKLRGDD